MFPKLDVVIHGAIFFTIDRSDTTDDIYNFTIRTKRRRSIDLKFLRIRKFIFCRDSDLI